MTAVAVPAGALARPGVRRPARVAQLAAAVRARLWAAVFALLGAGVRVTGARPVGPCVVVANHSSHADTPALLVALGGRAAPGVAAAADYWFAAAWRRAVCRSLVAAFPVRRSGGGSQDLAAAARLLEQGRVVVVFPEGSRARDGQLARFHAGAFRLATQAGVPIVPAAILGTADVLPVHGEIRPAPVEVRFGPPVAPDAEAARAAVASLLIAGPLRPARSRAFDAMRRLTDSPAGLALLFAWAAAEALCWPVLAEFALIVSVTAARARRVPAMVAALAAGSVAGVAVNVALARHGIVVPWPLTTARMHTTAAAQLHAHGAWALWSQMSNGIPVKVYARAAGQAGLPVWQLAAVAAVTRTLRMVVVGALCAGVARLARRVLVTSYPVLLVLIGASFPVLLAVVVSAWR